MILPKDEFFEALVSHFLHEALSDKQLMSARDALSRVSALLGDSPSFNTLETGMILSED